LDKDRGAVDLVGGHNQQSSTLLTSFQLSSNFVYKFFLLKHFLLLFLVFFF
jgi:hypothetical protein